VTLKKNYNFTINVSCTPSSQAYLNLGFGIQSRAVQGTRNPHASDSENSNQLGLRKMKS